MEDISNSKDNDYLSKIIEKYDFIESIIIRDYDGSWIALAFKNGLQKSGEDEKNIRSILSYNFSISLEQLSKVNNWKTNSVISFFDKHVIFKKKINEVVLCHIICDENEYYHEIIKNIADKLIKKFEPIKDKLLEIKKETEARNNWN